MQTQMCGTLGGPGGWRGIKRYSGRGHPKYSMEGVSNSCGFSMGPECLPLLSLAAGSLFGSWPHSCTCLWSPGVRGQDAQCCRGVSLGIGPSRAVGGSQLSHCKQALSQRCLCVFGGSLFFKSERNLEKLPWLV